MVRSSGPIGAAGVHSLQLMSGGDVLPSRALAVSEVLGGASNSHSARSQRTSHVGGHMPWCTIE